MKEAATTAQQPTELIPNESDPCRRIRNGLHAWAVDKDVPFDKDGYTERLEQNLYSLSAETRKDFEKGSGGEIRKTGRSKLQALHSSAALACNFFDPWRNADLGLLSDILGTESRIKEIKFEQKAPTGLRGTPPNLDVMLFLEDSTVVGIESKFMEPWTSSSKRNSLSASYFKEPYWDNVALPKCQQFIKQIKAGIFNFEFLDAAQLLKHALGLRVSFPKTSLWYLWFGVDGAASERHMMEVEVFANSIDPEVQFRSLTYLDLLIKIRHTHGVDQNYVEYLSTRYGCCC